MAHALNFDITTDAGQAIVDLFDGIKTTIASGEDWNGGDVVDALTAWFTALGFDVEAGPVGAPAA
ncbi:hypothetical protein AQJ30_15630 [Streptomyces longwoodensis]|uniref:Uncharacterized protein n=1 Tax=Streptomyces longwoodensis TaxID=68231 RepID=A0A101QXG6_9ACTN|nr:hypothetical protein [Streptomyces longwoodensis]KUN37713.1 hypothetical protein AQJ30_15630 [Streptomyces longwoodensis]